MRAPISVRVFAALLCGAWLCLPFAPMAHAQSSGGGEAGLVIEHGDGSIDTYCVAFQGNGITGAQMLAKVGIPVVQWNGAVCAVGSNAAEGCFQPHDFNSCFCKSFPPTNEYWGYFTQRDNQGWQYSTLGFASAVAHNGDMQAWRWGVGGPASAPPPPAMSFSQVCAAPTPAPPTATPPNTPAAATPTPAGAAGAHTAGAPAPPTITPLPPLVAASATMRAGAPASQTVRVTNHGTATATPAPALKPERGGSSAGAIAGFAAAIAGLAVATGAALIYRRRRSGQ